LDFSSFYDPANFTYPYGCHIAVVEVDKETGKVSLKRFIAVDDVGNVINPMIVDGQIHGGLAQGIGQAYWKEQFLMKMDSSSTVHTWITVCQEPTICRCLNLTVPKLLARITHLG
jgi:CO/xanthine dehydrogenase Mo-binding subunit